MEKFHGIGDLGNTVTPHLFYCLFTSDNYIVYRGRGSSVGQVFLVSEICRRNVNCLPFLCLVVVGRETRLWMEKSPRVSANWVTWTRKSSSELFVTNTFMHMGIAPGEKNQLEYPQYVSLKYEEGHQKCSNNYFQGNCYAQKHFQVGCRFESQKLDTGPHDFKL